MKQALHFLLGRTVIQLLFKPFHCWVFPADNNLLPVRPLKNSNIFHILFKQLATEASNRSVVKRRKKRVIILIRV